MVDDADRRVYAYNIANGAHVGNLGFALDNDQTQARGVYADANTMWVVDGSDRIYAYTITGGASYGQRDASREFQAQTNDGYPSGIHSIHANLISVVNFVDEQVYAYHTGRFSSMLGDRFESGDFDLVPHYAQPLGLWADDATTIWVVDAERKHVFAYQNSSFALFFGLGFRHGTRLPAREIRLDLAELEPLGHLLRRRGHVGGRPTRTQGIRLRPAAGAVGGHHRGHVRRAQRAAKRRSRSRSRTPIRPQRA